MRCNFMAVKKVKAAAAPAKENKATLTFSKSQLTRAKRFADYEDFLSGNLEDNKQYEIAEVEALIEKYYGKGKCD